MNCVKCGSACRILNSRLRSDNTVRRRHRCLHCGSRFTTLEKTAEQEEVDKGWREQLAAFRKAIEAALAGVKP